ncbi:MAG: histidine phosphatase family protein [Clostridiales bacterium]|nr:histidine phosphatase family protein [Clostridiales bacterium]MBP3811479.1 histidine phosphatase family protein [Clostridiales bacterium]
MRIVFVRHCEPDYTVDSLTPKGWREAKLLSHRVLNWNVDAFYESPLGRAHDTAKTCLDLRREHGKNSDVTVLPWLKEFYYQLKMPVTGEDVMCWDLMPSYFNGNKDLHDKDRWYDTDLMRSGNIRAEYEAVTSAFDELLKGYGYVRRSDGTYEVTSHNDKTIVMFCHFGVTALLTGHMTGVAPTCLWQNFFMAPSSVTIIGSEEREEGTASFRVQEFGSVSHLTDNNEPVSSSGYFAEVLNL